MKRYLLAIAAGAVLASGPVSARSIAVPTDDLNLASPTGQKVLERRIHKAARAVCAFGEAKVGTRIRDVAAHDCFQTAVTGALRQVAAIAAGEGGRSA